MTAIFSIIQVITAFLPNRECFSKGEFGGEFGNTGNFNYSYYADYYAEYFGNDSFYYEETHSDEDNWEKNFKYEISIFHFFNSFKSSANRPCCGNSYRSDFRWRHYRTWPDSVHLILSSFKEDLDEEHDAAELDLRAELFDSPNVAGYLYNFKRRSAIKNDFLGKI